jgi:nitrogen-specific signal transduction histidine kinase
VGLGLAIVDAIAKGHGGHCTVTSTARGSAFALVLPGFTAAVGCEAADSLEAAQPLENSSSSR